MEIFNNVDVIEQNVLNYNKRLMSLLLSDKTTKGNLHWCTDSYIDKGSDYRPDKEIQIHQITGRNTGLIQPRISKSKEEQDTRTKKKAEVFTPSWLCNAQNNLIDESWFGRKHVFNKEEDKHWITNKDKIEFTNEKTWTEYVDARRLEITCGEAPYLVSRYDSVDGHLIPFEYRIGLLDRKLRIVNENTDNKTDWFKWTLRAYQSTYGYDYQGDNVLLARENLLSTFVDHTRYKYHEEPSLSQMMKIANVIAWNIWQMDGITMNVPYTKAKPKFEEIRLFDFDDETTKDQSDESEEDLNLHKNGLPCLIRNWRSGGNGTVEEFKKSIRR